MRQRSKEKPERGPAVVGIRRTPVHINEIENDDLRQVGEVGEVEPCNYFTEICRGSEAGSYSRLMDFVYHSTLGLRVIKKKKKLGVS